MPLTNDDCFNPYAFFYPFFLYLSQAEKTARNPVRLTNSAGTLATLALFSRIDA